MNLSDLQKWEYNKVINLGNETLNDCTVQYTTQFSPQSKQVKKCGEKNEINVNKCLFSNKMLGFSASIKGHFATFRHYLKMNEVDTGWATIVKQYLNKYAV